MQSSTQFLPTIIDRMAITAIIWMCIVVVIQQTQGEVPEKNPIEYQVISERLGDVEILYVRNAAGILIEVIEEHANQNYQVIKPTDEKDHVCLIREIDQITKQEDTCYERVPLTPETNEQREDALAKCGDRKVYALQTVECSARDKRGCYLSTSAVSFCVRQESYCTSRGWWKCKSYGLRCAQSEVRNVVQILCT